MLHIGVSRKDYTCVEYLLSCKTVDVTVMANVGTSVLSIVDLSNDDQLRQLFSQTG